MNTVCVISSGVGRVEELAARVDAVGPARRVELELRRRDGRAPRHAECDRRSRADPWRGPCRRRRRALGRSRSSSAAMARRSAAAIARRTSASRCVAPGSIGAGSVGSSASRSTTLEPFLHAEDGGAVVGRALRRGRSRSRSGGTRRGPVTPKVTESKFVTFMSIQICYELNELSSATLLISAKTSLADGEIELLEGVARNSRT